MALGAAVGCGAMGQAPAREAPWLAAALGGGFQRCASPEETTETRTLSALLRPSDVTVLKVLKERFEEEARRRLSIESTDVTHTLFLYRPYWNCCI